MATTQIYPGAGLEIDFLGLPMIFNDGQAENHLVIALTNNNFFATLHPAQDSNIVFDRKSSISVWFVVDVAQGSAAAVRTWALTSYDEWHDAKVALTAAPGNWDIRRSDDLSGNPLNESLNGWQLTPREDLTLLPGQSLVLTLSGFTSKSPDGPTSGYVQVLMPPFDASGKATNPIQKVIGPITKSKIMISGERVGIGTGTPNSTLEVNGAVRARGGKPGLDDVNNNGFFFDGGGDADSGMTSLGEGNLTFYTSGMKAMVIKQQDNGLAGAEIRGDLRLGGHDYGASTGSLMVGGDARVVGDITALTGRIRDRWGPVMPVGAIIAYGGSEPPFGWLLCDGRSLKPDDYPGFDMGFDAQALRNIVGDHVPDLRDRFIVGAGQKKSGATGGEAEHVLTSDEMPAHSHLYNVAYSASANNGYIGDFSDQNKDWYFKVSDRAEGSVYAVGPSPDDNVNDRRFRSLYESGRGVAHNNMPPYYALTYIIKY